MFKKMLVTLPLLVGMLVVGCDSMTGPFSEPGSDSLGTTSLALSADIIPESDVSAIRFTVTRVACPGEGEYEDAEYEAVEDLKDFCLPTSIDPFMDDPADEDSCHLFADAFFVLPAGCYDVLAEALSDGDDSEDCSDASAEGVEVVDGETTEIVLVHQCQGPPVGALDVISVINNTPTILDLEYEKFTDDCEGVEVCATAFDPDGDPLEFEWELLAGPALLSAPEVVSREDNPDGSVTECVLIETGDAGEYDLRVTVYDLVWDEGELIRVEEWLEDQGQPNESRDSLEFPIYASEDCPDNGQTIP